MKINTEKAKERNKRSGGLPWHLPLDLIPEKYRAGKIPPRRERHQPLIETIIEEAGEEGITTGEVYEEYVRLVEDRKMHPFKSDEKPYTQRSVRHFLSELSEEGVLFYETVNAGHSGRTTRYWHRKVVSNE